MGTRTLDVVVISHSEIESTENDPREGGGIRYTMNIHAITSYDEARFHNLISGCIIIIF
jgi:hypothetical protein